MADSSRAKRFDFPNMISQWLGYNSTTDQTNVGMNLMTRGSQNIYKKLSGTLSVREGEMRLGVANTTNSPVSSEFVWETSWGETYILLISDSTLYIVINDIWYPLLTSLTATRYVFDKWWNQAESKDQLVFVNGTTNLYSWSGGMATADYGTNTATTHQALLMNGGDNALTSFGAITGTAPFIYNYNGQIKTLIRVALLFSANPSNGQTLTFSINGNSISVQFVSAIGATAGNVLIGATLDDTLTNLKGLLNFTGTTNATQVAFSGPNQVFMNYLSGFWGKTNTIVKTSPTTSWASAGFSASGSVIIGATTFSYSGGTSGSFLYGVQPDPSGISTGTVAVQTVEVNATTPNATFLSDFLKVVNNQVYLGSYSSNNIFISSNINYNNFTIPVPRVKGSAELVVLDGLGKGIGVRQGVAWVGYGYNGWAGISFADVSNNNILTNVTTKTNKPMALLQAPYAHEFIDTVNDNIIYLGQDQQVREFGDFNTAFVAMYPSLSQDVATELLQQDFTGGCLRCIGEFIYVCSPTSGKVYLRQERTNVDANGTVVAERLWHSPFIWNISRIEQANGQIIGFSNSNPQIYQLWGTNQWHDDSPTDEPLPYSCILALGYRNNKKREGMMSFDKLYTEGYLLPGSPVNVQVNYNYLGSTNKTISIINSVDQPVTLFTISNQGTTGGGSLGENPLGDLTTTDNTVLPKFRIINSLTLINCFEFQTVYYSDTADACWEILAVGDNEVEADADPIFIGTGFKN